MHLHLKGSFGRENYNDSYFVSPHKSEIFDCWAGVQSRRVLCGREALVCWNIFELLWADILNSRIKVLVSSFCRGHPGCVRSHVRAGSKGKGGNPRRSAVAALKLLACRLT